MHDLEENEHNFPSIWQSFLTFENMSRRRGEKLNEFIIRWKENMALAQYAGCEYSDALLACKLLQKANLDEIETRNVVSSIVYAKSEMLCSLICVLEDKNSLENPKRQNSQSLASKIENGHSKPIKEETQEELFIVQKPDNCPALKTLPELEIKEESPEVAQSVIDVDLAELVVHHDELFLEKKPAKTRKRKVIEETKIHSCDFCGKNFDRARLLQAHISKFHRESKITKFKNNISEDENDPDLSKELLDEDLEQENDFCEEDEAHIKTENENTAKSIRSKVPKSQCELCGKRISQKLMERHQEKCLSRSQGTEAAKQSEKKRKIERLQCEYCGKDYPTRGRLKEHYGRCPNLEQEQRDAKGYIWPSNRRVTCKICNKTFARQHNYRLHLSLHSGEKNFKCDVCPAAFANSLYLVYHKKRHEGWKRHYCKSCPKSFTESSGLKRHIMREHTNERPYQCPHCSHSTVDKNHLNRHIRSHTGETPFKCNLCGKLYRDKKSVKRHMKAHHGQCDANEIVSGEVPAEKGVVT